MGIDILTVDNIFQYGVPTIILILFLYWFMRPMVSQNKEALETVTQVLKQSLDNSIRTAKEEQTAFINALAMVEERHKESVKAISQATAEKLETVISRTDALIDASTVLMQQNERLSNDANTIIQTLKVSENQKRMENELIALKEIISGVVNNNNAEKNNRKQSRL